MQLMITSDLDGTNCVKSMLSCLVHLYSPIEYYIKIHRNLLRLILPKANVDVVVAVKHTAWRQLW